MGTIKTVTSFLLALGIFHISMGQKFLEINGRVVDRRSMSALPYAHVGINKTSIGTVSNEKGEFRIVVPNEHRYDTLTISYLGYHTYRSPVSVLVSSCVFYLDEAPVILNDVVIKAGPLDADEILLKAAENLIQNENYPMNDFKLEGFYREVQKVNGELNFSVESAFDVYDDRCTKPLTGIEIMEFRKMFHRDQGVGNKLYENNNLLRLFDVSTNFVVLARKGLKDGKTTWAIGKRPYEIAEVSVFNDREVYIIIHENDFVSLKIIIDVNNFSVLRNEYHTKQPVDNFNNYFWKYHQGAFKCGFFESHQIYEYREFKGKMYPHIFYRNDLSRCFGAAGKMESESHGSYQALISNIQLNQKRPKNLKNLKKNNGMQAIDFKYNEEFWRHYNIIIDSPQESGH